MAISSTGSSTSLPLARNEGGALRVANALQLRQLPRATLAAGLKLFCHPCRQLGRRRAVCWRACQKEAGGLSASSCLLLRPGCLSCCLPAASTGPVACPTPPSDFTFTCSSTPARSLLQHCHLPWGCHWLAPSALTPASLLVTFCCYTQHYTLQFAAHVM